MDTHAALIPSFRDFSHYAVAHLAVPEPELRKPTVLEVERALRESPAGREGAAISTDGWPWTDRLCFLDDVIPGILVHSMGGLAPFQADGIWGPYEWYYRERGGQAELRLAPIATFPSAQESLYSAQSDAREFSGSQGWIQSFLKLWEKLERSPFLYEFPAKEVLVENQNGTPVPVLSGAETTQAGWGYSPTEAWLNAASYSAYLDEQLGWTRELQEERRNLMDISREPSNRDERVYPLDDPDFTVSWDRLLIPDELKRFGSAA